MTTDVDAFAQLLQTGLITALVNILSFVGVLVVLSLMSWPLTARRAGARATTAHRDRLVRAALGARLRARPRDHLHRQRGVPGEHLRRARIAGLRARGAQHRLVPRHREPLPRRPAAHPGAPGDLLPVHPVPRHLRRRDRARPRERARARRHHRRRHRHRVPPLPRPVLRAGAAAVAGVRPVATGRGVDEQDQRADADPDDHARRRPTQWSPTRSRARSASPTCTSRTPAPVGRPCTASTSRSAPGETVALVGETGAGKSTLVKLVARFYDADAGQVLVDGVPITDLDLRAYRRRLGYVPQEAFLFSGTVRDNIAYGRPDATDAEVEQRGTRGRRARVHRRAARRVSAPGHRARAVALGRAAAAASASPARCSSTRPSCCSTRRPPTST